MTTEAPAKRQRVETGTAASVKAKLGYQHGDTIRTLVRNGQLKLKLDGRGSPLDVVGMRMVPTDALVANARLMAEPACLNREGFMLVTSPTSLSHHDCFDESIIFQKYYGECKELVRNITGAALVEVFDHNVRRAAGIDPTAITDHELEQELKRRCRLPSGAAMVVHGDFTQTSAADRFRRMADPPRVGDKLLAVSSEPLLSSEWVERGFKHRFMIVNIWRPILDEPVEVFPLAMCDSRSASKDDLCVLEIDYYGDRVSENYYAVASQRHKWFYYPKMDRSEALLIKTWDSLGSVADGGAFCLHTAFHDPTCKPGAIDRESIEVRLICVFDEQQPPAG